MVKNTLKLKVASYTEYLFAAIFDHNVISCTLLLKETAFMKLIRSMRNIKP